MPIVRRKNWRLKGCARGAVEGREDIYVQGVCMGVNEYMST